ncbi:MAG: hypothetical protein ABS939_00135 [Psychrobacillus sp.]
MNEVYSVVKDSYGNYRLEPIVGGSPVKFAFAMGLFVLFGAIMVFIMEEVFKRGKTITLIFIIASIVLCLVQVVKKSIGPGMLRTIHMYVVSPFFVIYLYAGLSHWTPWIDNFQTKLNEGNLWYGLVLLIYICGSPIFAILFAPFFTAAVSLLSKIVMQFGRRDSAY